MTSNSTAIRRTHVTVPSPVGPLTIVATDDMITGLYMNAQRHAPAAESLGVPGDSAAGPFATAAAQLSAYFAGELTEFNLPLAPAGTEFQRKVWAGLRAIPYGQTISYGDLARRLRTTPPPSPAV